MNHASDVFGIGRDLPLNYVERDGVDNVLLDSLSRNKHIVVYGSSKQGKTSLRKHCLHDTDYVTIHCHSKWELADVHSAILKAAGFEIEQSNTIAVSGKKKILAKFSARILGTGVEAKGEQEDTKSTSRTYQALEIDPADVNDIITALGDFSKFIVLEDFHYLPADSQREFAVALKAFHEQSKHTFIITGVWLEESRLAVYNGDLAGRLIGINADEWTKQQLAKVISLGEELLNVKLDEIFKENLLENCQDSVYVIQEACLKACEIAGISKTIEQQVTIGEGYNAIDMIQKVVAQQSGRYNAFITQFAAGFQDTTLHMYRWVLFPVLTASIESLTRGFRYKEIREILQQHHPTGEDLNPGNVTQALLSTASLQVKKNIKPIILDYDQTNLKLSVVDRGFLVWIQVQERRDLLELAELPITEGDA